MTLARQVGAVLLVVGGVLETARLIVLTLISPVWPLLLSMAVNLGPSLCIGAGLIALGVSTRGRGRLPLLVAGVLELVAVVVNAVQMATLSPFGPAPSLLAGVAAWAAVVVAAALLLTDRALQGPARSALAVPAACIVVLIVGVYAPALPAVRVDLLPGIGFAVAGALLLRRARSGVAPARPVQAG